MLRLGSGGIVVLVAAAVFAAAPESTPGEWVEVVPPIVAGFTRASYSPGEIATLRVRTRSPLLVDVEHVDRLALTSDEISGTPVTDRVSFRFRPTLHIRIGNWASGVYVVRLESSSGREGFAPLIVRPARWGLHRVAVVLPTYTWEAYNFRDDDHDGVGDTWYASRSIDRVNVTRPFLNHGLPPHFKEYDSGFLAWFAQRGHEADFFSDEDLAAGPTGAALARRYDLIVFPGHEEYVTRHEYDVITRYRNLGGNLMFLSANSFFRDVRPEGRWLVRLARWRDVGRPESALVGGQIVGWFENRFPNRPFVVVGAQRAPWLFANTNLRNGSRFGNYGIEINARTRASPPGTKVLASIPNIFGPGRSAEMTYYETARGAKVFDAGVMNFGGTTDFPLPGKLMDNLWARLSRR